ncbi:MAG TPA: selenide, water dikinase SelD [Dissulfurispiraceae bacterium]|nr:selenide, water dikinase SelD [Dissulfurispiraceae bacterium]
MGPSDLEDILGSLRPFDNREILVGPGDDAGVCLIGQTAIVETVDIITPVVNDPFTFGAISANNSISDVYAMGGRPVSALAIAGFSSCTYGPEVLKEILRGAVETLRRAGAFLIGGHSFEDEELKFGLSVTGAIDRDRILRVTGAGAGDAIVLTKPIGVGVLTTALKGGKMDDGDMGTVISWMTTLNDEASRIALQAGATACTDVTGFGLLGHALSMVRKTSVDFVLDHSILPVLDRVKDMIERGMVPEGAYNNLRFLEGKVDFSSEIGEEERLLMADPQTSGGLLVTLPPGGVRLFREAGLFHVVVGKVVSGSGRIRVV